MQNLVGQKFGKLKVFDIENKISNSSIPRQICVCDCGNVVKVHHYNLISSKITDCGNCKIKAQIPKQVVHDSLAKEREEKLTVTDEEVDIQEKENVE